MDVVRRLAEIGPNLAESCQTFAESVPKHHPNWNDVRPSLVNTGLNPGQTQANFGRYWAKFGRERPNWAESGKQLAEIMPSSAEVA